MKKLLYVTGSRAEYGIMKRLLSALMHDEDVDLSIVATGMHCEEKYGLTYKQIESDGFCLHKRIPIDIDTTNNAAILASMSLCQTQFGQYFHDHPYDAVMLLGDRYEILPVAIAAAMHNLPIIHLHGGEKTLGNYDEFIRHAITKMSKLHLASTETYRKRIIQLGENPASVFNIGALGAENSLSLPLPTKSALSTKFGSLDKPYFMVVFHPETLNDFPLSRQIEELLSALYQLKDQYDFIFIGSNSDTGSNEITEKIRLFCHHNQFRFMTSISPEEYLSLIKYSQGLVGNSSSGLIEVPSLLVPTINIGDRQKGRVKGDTVIDCRCEEKDIYQAVVLSQSETFQNLLAISTNPYFQDNVLEAALEKIKCFLSSEPIKYKDFYDLNPS
ncbi:UDP-N-acetylglucosamine 2-epimerase (hydrolyzing) [Photobacterium gaetbulicola]|uniref:Polysialic acid biosynthesis protein P7 n=1 Tax=Photobacterium gaetbulicola Gung47 TaxID=658445 RepID=A0A0C5WQX8_9GAMM|nr:UDP-N-acetylglucosamine 2-epimerase [Photobacterium gaetbulicola]AJR09573.1 polysialic acid biosynthesis protein P7 [Photobacterium gaetbulicola Gung47]PSU14366.1 UDP-N-acetylglucosamine 2-epimerase (hydrolyzing) [Photobacterium gaetbulicola]